MIRKEEKTVKRKKRKEKRRDEEENYMKQEKDMTGVLEKTRESLRKKKKGKKK